MFCYVLFVKTGYEQKVMNDILTWQIDGLHPYVPMRDVRFRKAGEILSERKCWIPGYVFIESGVSGTDFYISIKPYISRSENALKLLRYGSGYSNQSFEMKKDEQSIFLRLLGSDRCVEMSRGFVSGGVVKVNSGPLSGYEGLVKKINRHKMEAVIEINMMGALREIKVGLEIVEKLP